MAKEKLKTTATKLSVAAYLDGIKDPLQKRDAKKLTKICRAVSNKRAPMWGAARISSASGTWT